MKQYLINIDGEDQIQDNEYLYRYMLKKALPEGQDKLPSDTFTDPDLSCDWARLQLKPEESYHVKKNNKELIVRIKVCNEIRNPSIGGKLNPNLKQKILHTPGKSDPHSVINGPKKAPVTRAISDNAEVYSG